MRLKSQTSAKRLSLRKRDTSIQKPSLTVILLMLIALLIMPISLKASFKIFGIFSETSNTNKTMCFCDD